MPNDSPNPYSIPASTIEPKVPRHSPSLQLTIFINVATWAVLLAIPVTLSIFTFTIPTEIISDLYYRFSFWHFLPFYFVTLSAVNGVLYRHASGQRHVSIQFHVLICAAMALMPFVLIMLIAYDGPWL